MKILPMVDMRITPKEAEDYFPSSQDIPAYPYGLSIRLCSDELDKLGIKYTDLDTDDMVHLHCLAVVISKCKSERQNGDDNEEVCLQITHISAESEDEENESQDVQTKMRKLYSKG